MLKRMFFALVLVIPLGGCGIFTGTNVEGYSTLDTVLVGQEAARKQVFDVAAAYLPVQEVLKQAMLNPDVGSEFKTAIVLVNREMTSAIKDYRIALDLTPDVFTARLLTAMQVLQRAQQLLLQYTAGQVG